MDPEILAALGLSEDAGKEEVLNAIKALQGAQAEAEAKAAESETKKEEAEAKCRALEADAFIAKHAEKIADVAAFKEIYIKDAEMAKKALGAFKTMASVATSRISAKDAKTPADGAKTDVAAGLAKCRNAKERCEYAMRHAKEW